MEQNLVKRFQVIIYKRIFKYIDFSTGLAGQTRFDYVWVTLNPTTEKLNLVEIVSKHVLLQQSRKALKGKCLFHHDETTSLLVIPHSNIYKCFGCGAEGGPIEFLVAMEGKHC